MWLSHCLLWLCEAEGLGMQPGLQPWFAAKRRSVCTKGSPSLRLGSHLFSLIACCYCLIKVSMSNRGSNQYQTQERRSGLLHRLHEGTQWKTCYLNTILSTSAFTHLMLCMILVLMVHFVFWHFTCNLSAEGLSVCAPAFFTSMLFVTPDPFASLTEAWTAVHGSSWKFPHLQRVWLLHCGSANKC